MRLLHVVAPAGFGGLERVVQTLAAAQRRAGDDVHVAAFFSNAATLEADGFSGPLVEAGVRVHALIVPVRAYATERSAVAKLAREMKAEILHTHGYRPDVVSGPVAHTVGAVAITTVHGFTGGSLRNRFYEWLQRRAFRQFDAVVAVSRPLADRLAREGLQTRRRHLVVNGWTGSAEPLSRAVAREMLGVPSDGLLLGWVGRISAEKGLDVLARAMPLVAMLPAHLAVVGSGPDRSLVEGLLRASGQLERVTWCGVVPDAARVFAAFDVFVLSSRTEGTPMVLFEAMSAGVPIVASRVGGVPDLLTTDEAILIAPENPEALAQAIRDVVEHPAAAAERVLAARQRLEQVSDVARWAKSYADVYRVAIAQRAQR